MYITGAHIVITFITYKDHCFSVYTATISSHLAALACTVKFSQIKIPLVFQLKYMFMYRGSGGVEENYARSS